METASFSYVFRKLKPQSLEGLPQSKFIEVNLDWNNNQTFYPWITRYFTDSKISKELIHPQLLQFNTASILHSSQIDSFCIGDIFTNTSILNLFHIHSSPKGIKYLIN